MIDVSDAKQLMGQTLTDSDGGKVGKIGQIYLDDFRGQPEWVTVHTGLFGTNESFVPLAEATKADGGLRVPYSKKQIQGAPNIDEAGELTEAQEQDLYTYYGVPYTTEGSTFADLSGTTGTTNGTAHTETTDTRNETAATYATGTGTATTGTSGTSDTSGTTSTSRTTGTDTYDTDRDTDRDVPSVGHDTSGRNTDDAMTRSEEQLNVGTEQVATGKARLRKYVETENVQVEVPVKKEKARLVTEPITDANRGDALSGGDITEEEHEVTLSEERPVVSKETVPVERVRLDKEVVENTETVNDDVRKERIEFDGDDAAGRNRS